MAGPLNKKYIGKKKLTSSGVAGPLYHAEPNQNSARRAWPVHDAENLEVLSLLALLVQEYDY